MNSRGGGNNSWWHRASTEQKLRQLDAGIELGLTARAIAVCSGLPSTIGGGKQTVEKLAYYHGRKFYQSGGMATGAKRKRVADLKRAYWRDGARDFTDQALRHDDTPEVQPLSFDDEVS